MSCLIRIPLIVSLLVHSGFIEAATDYGPTHNRLRTIVTTDGEGDDQCSMVRFLLYANEWDICGLIHSSSKHHWKGDATHPTKNWKDTVWLDHQLNQYARVYPNLILHDPSYPTPDHLRKQVFVGNIAYEGEMEASTPGSDRIVEVLLHPDPSPVWLQAWGGANTIARALKTIEETHADRMAEVVSKARLFLIALQDSTLHDYILKQWPGIFVIRSSAYGAIAYDWRNIMTPDQQKLFDKDWLRENILTAHGPLCAAYKPRPNGDFRSEGDSPAFMHLIDVGLRQLENPAFGGWGGRFVQVNSLWRSAPDNDDVNHAILRWAVAFQNDWAARADWCVHQSANHPPQVSLDPADDLLAAPNQTLQLSAKLSTDPDGHPLDFTWWQYAEPGTYPGILHLPRPQAPEIQLVIPADARPGDTLHLICEVTDRGVPPLTRYQRLVITVAPP